MTCTDLRDLISAYVDGELHPAQQELVELHIEHCVVCQTYLVQHQRARQLLMDAAYAQGIMDWIPDLAGTIQARLPRSAGQRTGTVVYRNLFRGLRQTVVPLSVICAMVVGVLIGRAGLLIGSVGQVASLSSTSTRQHTSMASTPAPKIQGRMTHRLAQHRGAVTTTTPALSVKVVMKPTQRKRTVAIVIVETAGRGVAAPVEEPVQTQSCLDIHCVQEIVRAALEPPSKRAVMLQPAVVSVGQPEQPVAVPSTPTELTHPNRAEPLQML